MENNKLTEKQISDMKHAIGYQPQSVKKGVYKPYRKYYAVSAPNDSWEDLVRLGYASKSECLGNIYYFPTDKGRKLLGDILGITILAESR